MANIFAPGGYELATKSMIPGNGINLLDGTKTFQNISISAGSFTVDDTNNKITSNKAMTKIFHAYLANQKQTMLHYNKPLNLVPGYYTLSFVVAGNDDTGGNTPTMSVFNGSELLANGNTPVINKATFISIPFKVETVNPINLVFGSDKDEDLPGGSFWYANLKLEAGVNPTPWSESVADQIQELKSELQAK